MKYAIYLIPFAITASMAHAEENLLWKATNIASAVVVPAYAGQASPFPAPATEPVAVSETVLLDEQRRLRDEAYQSAEKIVNSNSALVPDFRGVRVGGYVEGTLGARVLIGNQWIAVGKQLPVPLYRSPQALHAITALSEYDSAAASELAARLNSKLATTPNLVLTLKNISAGKLTFTSPRGEQVIPYSMQN